MDPGQSHNSSSFLPFPGGGISLTLPAHSSKTRASRGSASLQTEPSGPPVRSPSLACGGRHRSPWELPAWDPPERLQPTGEAGGGGREEPGLAAGQSPSPSPCPVPTLTALPRAPCPCWQPPLPPISPSRGLSPGVGVRSRPVAVKEWCWVTRSLLGEQASAGKAQRRGLAGASPRAWARPETACGTGEPSGPQTADPPLPQHRPWASG